MMHTENIKHANMPDEQLQKDVQENLDASAQYKRVLLAEDEEENTPPVDSRRVQHGHGPCACCGPYSE